MNAKKCDRCGKFYDNSDIVVYRVGKNGYYTRKNLCPECFKELQ